VAQLLRLTIGLARKINYMIVTDAHTHIRAGTCHNIGLIDFITTIMTEKEEGKW